MIHANFKCYLSFCFLFFFFVSVAKFIVMWAQIFYVAHIQFESSSFFFYLHLCRLIIGTESIDFDWCFSCVIDFFLTYCRLHIWQWWCVFPLTKATLIHGNQIKQNKRHKSIGTRKEANRIETKAEKKNNNIFIMSHAHTRSGG